MSCAQDKADKGNQLHTTPNGSTHEWGFQCSWETSIVLDQCSSVQFPAHSTFIRWLRNNSFTAHLLHTPTPNTLFLYAPDNILTASPYVPYRLPFSQIKLLITHESFSHSPLFPKETPGFLELRSQKYPAEKIVFTFLSLSSFFLWNCSFL
jgi:hypothetical protein